MAPTARRMSRWLFASIVALIPVAAYCAEDSVPEERLVQSVQHGIYTFNVHRTEYSALNVVSRLEVLKNGVVLPFSDWVNWYDSPLEDNEISVFHLGQDVTGNGVPDVVVRRTTVGNRQYHGYYVFELGSKLRHVDGVYTGNALAEFVDLDGKPGLEVETVDDVFKYYWKGDQGTFRPPRVVLRFKDGKYQIAPDLMRMPRRDLKNPELFAIGVDDINVRRPKQRPIPKDPTPEELAAFALEVRDSPVWRQDHRPIPRELTHVMWNLIYVGAAERAVQFFHSAWPDWREGKDEFFREFYQCQLRVSDYWPAIAEMNGLPAEKPVGDCPGLYD